MERVRGDGGTALAHALGWNLTKHALGVYGSSPPPEGWRRAGGPALQAWVDGQAHPAMVAEPGGRGTIEAYTVVHGRDGAPERGVVIGRLDDAHRFIAVLPADRGLLEDMERVEGVGRGGAVRFDGQRCVFDPA
jgi:acetyl-CoA C-acetyltransferase